VPGKFVQQDILGLSLLAVFLTLERGKHRDGSCNCRS
jgi:hypothetical protein